jgi:hypothetical protein
MVSARGARLEWHGINVRKVDILSALGESRIDPDGQHAHPTYKDTMLLIVNPVPVGPESKQNWGVKPSDSSSPSERNAPRQASERKAATEYLPSRKQSCIVAATWGVVTLASRGGPSRQRHSFRPFLRRIRRLEDQEGRPPSACLGDHILLSRPSGLPNVDLVNTEGSSEPCKTNSAKS